MMTSLEGVLSASKTEPAGKAAVAGKVVLVMQGGGAQAAYEGGSTRRSTKPVSNLIGLSALRSAPSTDRSLPGTKSSPG